MVEKFDINPTRPKPFTLVFPHIPKTGGTTLLYHFRRNLGDKSVLSYGPHNRVVRFFSDLPQFEELDARDIAKLRVIQGHGVSSDLLPRLEGGPVKLLVVLRHPVSLMRSRFNHRKGAMAGRGLTIDTDMFLAHSPANFMTELLLDKFSPFVDADAGSTHERIVSVLRKFDYVFTTECLDRQVGGLMRTLGLSERLERRRVAGTKAVLEMSDAGIARREALDLGIFQSANIVVSGQAGHNPFGFDRDGRERAMAVLATAGPENPAGQFHDRLAAALCHSLRAQAALAKIGAGGPVALRDPAGFRDVLERRWENLSSTLTRERAEISRAWRDRWCRNNR